MIDISLVLMPYADVQRPSIALGLLQATLADTEIRSEIVYANLRFAEIIGLPLYRTILATPTDHLLGEWCFADAVFPDFRPDEETYLDLVLEVRSTGFAADLGQSKAMVREVRVQAAAYVDRLAAAILARRPRIVGCSSMFQQHCASLALLKRIRELSPETITLMGGANCEGEMGVEALRAFSWVDCVVSGEADTLFTNLCRLLLDQRRDIDPALLPHGAMVQGHWCAHADAAAQLSMNPPRSTVRHLDMLPTPDYDTYFGALQTSTLARQIKPGLPVESSRGCWWGEKSHCTFCGLNGIGMAYRSKSPERVIAELAELSERYGVHDFQFVDNILDMSHLKTVLPALASGKKRYSLFYETKSNLKRDQLRTLAQAGVRWIQPGTESLHDGVLKLIAKGNSALMNLQLLKWAREFGIRLSWNLLCGFPGESDDWYSEMADWLPAIFRLQPPSGIIRVRYDRFSPYHMRPEDFGLTLTPSRSYAYIYPLPSEALRRLAYSFEDADRLRHIHRGVPDQPGQQRLRSIAARWNQAWRQTPPTLRVVEDGDRLRVVDTRPGAQAPHWTVKGLPMAVYRICDSAHTPEALLRHLNEQRGSAVSWPEVEAAVEALCRAKLMLRLHGKLLSLGVNGAHPDLPTHHDFPGGTTTA